MKVNTEITKLIAKLGSIALALFLLTSNTNAENNGIINPLNIQPILQGLNNKIDERTKRAQKAINERAKEYNNIRNSNELYHKQHPEKPRIKTPIPNFMGTAINAYNTEKPIYKDDQDPHTNPHEWDSIGSKDKTCWIHKTTRRKICENNH